MCFPNSLTHSLLQRGEKRWCCFWLPGTDYWEDVVGEILASSGKLWHMNNSYIKWQEWEDVVGECPSEGKRSSYQINLDGSFLFFTDVEE